MTLFENVPYKTSPSWWILSNQVINSSLQPSWGRSPTFCISCFNYWPIFHLNITATDDVLCWIHTDRNIHMNIHGVIFTCASHWWKCEYLHECSPSFDFVAQFLKQVAEVILAAISLDLCCEQVLVHTDAYIYAHSNISPAVDTVLVTDDFHYIDNKDKLCS